MEFGYTAVDGEVLELTPSTLLYLSKQERRRVFVNFFNSCVDGELKIKSVKSYKNLHEIFTEHIEYLLKSDTSSCKISDMIIKNYTNKNYDFLKQIYPIMPVNKGAKLINMIYAKDEVGLCFDASMLFSNYIYDKISRLHGTKSVTVEDGLIILKRDGQELLGVIPSFKYVSKPQEMGEEIDRAFKILQKRDIKKLFIAFPKNEEFTKHLAVKQYSNDEETRLTLVPYAVAQKSSCGFLKQ